MKGSRKGALLMLVVAVLWGTLPASACMLTLQSSGQLACCRGMAQGCPMRGTNMTSCCRIYPQNAEVIPDLLFSPELSQKLGVASHRASPGAFAIPGVVVLNTIESPPPDFPPGASPILRI